MRRLILIAAIAIVALQVAAVFPAVVRGQSASFTVLSPTFVRVGGKVYHLDAGNAPFGWRELPYLSFTLPPVPVTSLVSLTTFEAITDTGEGWMLRNGWESAGQLPGTVATIKSSWGAVKARYR